MGDPGSIPGSGRSPGEGNGYPLQYSCLGNPMDGGAWRATVRAVTESDTTEATDTYIWLIHSFTKAETLIILLLLSHSAMRDSAALWTIAHQAPLSMTFSRQEYWSGLPFPPPDLPHPGIEHASASPVIPALAGEFFTTGKHASLLLC